MQNQSIERYAYRISEACFALGIGRTSLYEMIGNGQIAAIKIAGRTLIPRSEIERLTSLESSAKI